MGQLARKIERVLRGIETRARRAHADRQPRYLVFESEAALEAAQERGEVPPGVKLYLGIVEENI